MATSGGCATDGEASEALAVADEPAKVAAEP